jgi:hypothetical protein
VSHHSPKVTKHEGHLPEDGPDGWGLEPEDLSVGIWGGVYHEPEDGRDHYADIGDTTIVATEEYGAGVRKRTVSDEYSCSCGARLRWTHHEVEYDDEYISERPEQFPDYDSEGDASLST